MNAHALRNRLEGLLKKGSESDEGQGREANGKVAEREGEAGLRHGVETPDTLPLSTPASSMDRDLSVESSAGRGLAFGSWVSLCCGLKL